MAKKPSNQIIDILNGLQPLDAGSFPPPSDGWFLSNEQHAEIIRLCKMTDKRDQQLRKARKPAKKAAKR